MSRVLFMRFDTPDGVLPRDPARGWDVVESAGGVIPPPVEDPVALITGRGWTCDAGNNYGWALQPVTTDAIPGGNPYDLTIACGVRCDVAGWGALAPTFLGIVAQAELADSECTWRLCLEPIDIARKIIRPRLMWRNAADSAWVSALGPWFVAAPDRSYLVQVAREHSTAGFVVRWVIDDQAAGETTTTWDIWTSPDPDHFIAVGHDPAGVYAGHLGVLEFFDLHNIAATYEQMIHTGRRFTTLAPMLQTAIKRAVPRDVYSSDPTSIIQRELRVEATAISVVRSEADILTRGLAPTLAWGELLERWEAICELPPGAFASIDDRHEALARHLRLDGSSLDEIRIALAGPLGQLAADVDVRELDMSEFRDDFDVPVFSGAHLTSGHDAARWSACSSTWTFLRTGVIYRLSLAGGTGTDTRYLGRAQQGNAHPPMLLHATGEGGKDTFWQAGFTVATIGDDNTVCGIVVGDVENDDYTWFGVYKVAGVNKFGWIRYTGEDASALETARHTLPVTINFLVNFTPSAPAYIRVRDLGAGGYQVQISATDPADWSLVTTYTIAGGTPRPRWGGIGVVGQTASTAAAYTLEATYYFERAPKAPGRLTFEVFRDPGLPGSYDLQAAALVLDRFKPAHVDGSAVTTEFGLYYEDAATLVDRDPMRS